MCDKPNLTIDSALEDFRKECRDVLEAAGYESYSFQMCGNSPGDSHWVDKWRKMVCYSHRKYHEADTDNLIAAAVKWLAGKDLHYLIKVERRCPGTYGPGFRFQQIPPDFLRWLLEEVRGQLNQEAAWAVVHETQTVTVPTKEKEE